ncbi:MAG: hypothetical protein A2X35_02410 [Elusimicrobia bacterium GWA2_61_42]|nr:MAG: hypothetical protein A2X35_02410 [Elusimicrobia bacterium GWA2_61_42]OGR75125.1 MAG: hypothetical protein A2X38_06330 [Elusimicrobia bacterium GWC2_61_25]
MNGEKTRKAYLAAAAAAGGIIAAVFFYAGVVEVLRKLGHKPPLTPPAAYALKYALYLAGAASLAALKQVNRLQQAKKSTLEETLKALTLAAVVRAAVCEVPAVCGLVLFLLTGYYADFYLLAAFSAALGVYNFPRLSAWETRLREDFGQL